MPSLLQLFAPGQPLLAPAIYSAQLLAALFLAILFLQSGMDKIFDWRGNLSFLSDHFSRSPLGKLVPLLLGAITAFEVAAGLACGIGFLSLLVSGSTATALFGAQLSALSLTLLFLGQRLAKDYEGAATLVSYFILTLLAILLLSGSI